MSSLVYPDLPGRIYPVKCRVMWRTNRDSTASGRKFRWSNWSYPIYEWTLGYDVLRDSAGEPELQQIVGLYNLLGGGLDYFLFYDDRDGWNSVTDQGLGIGNGVNRDFPLLRSYGGFVEPVDEKRGAITIMVNGSPTSDYAWLDNRIVRFNTAPANGAVITWTGGYYWRCIFPDDTLETEQFMRQFHAARSVKFERVKA